MLTHTHIHIICSDTRTLHTCGSCRWYFLNSLTCAFPPLSSSGERPVAAEGSPPLCDRGLWGIFLLGRRRVSQGWQKHFNFGWAKSTSVVMHLRGGCKAAHYPLKPLKEFDCSMLCVKHIFVRGTGGTPFPTPQEILECRMSENTSVGYTHLS